MKRFLAICSIFFSVCFCFTGCGSSDTPYDSNSERDYSSRRDAGEFASDVISGVGEAGGEMIEGVTDAAEDIIDGFDDDSSSRTHRSSRDRSDTNDMDSTTALTTTTKSYISGTTTR